MGFSWWEKNKEMPPTPSAFRDQPRGNTGNNQGLDAGGSHQPLPRWDQDGENKGTSPQETPRDGVLCFKQDESRGNTSVLLEGRGLSTLPTAQRTDSLWEMEML